MPVVPQGEFEWCQFRRAVARANPLGQWKLTQWSPRLPATVTSCPERARLQEGVGLSRGGLARITHPGSQVMLNWDLRPFYLPFTGTSVAKLAACPTGADSTSDLRLLVVMMSEGGGGCCWIGYCWLGFARLGHLSLGTLGDDSNIALVPSICSIILAPRTQFEPNTQKLNLEHRTCFQRSSLETQVPRAVRNSGS